MNSSAVLVTGGNRGIGAAIVDCLASRGFNVAWCSRSAREEAIAPNIRSYRCDVSVAAEREALIDAVFRDFGAIRALVNNAGVAPNVRGDLTQLSEESLDRLLKINLAGPVFLTQLIARRWIADPVNAAEKRCIVNIASVSSVFASTNRGDYCISKAGVSMATKLWAARLGEIGTPVFEVRPGIIRTDMTAGVTEKYDALIEGGLTLQRRWGEAADVARAVAALVSGDFAYCTGSVINVDGGLSVERF